MSTPWLHQVVPVPGPRWGQAPQRPDPDAPLPRRRLAWGRTSARCHTLARAAATQAQACATQDAATRRQHREQAAAALRRQGFTAEALAPALGLAAACAAEALGQAPFHTQLFAAAALLDNRFAEMATGEGKTLATALAAATAALAGVPVHVVTANDYLAERDAARLAPLFQALGLHAAWLDPAATDDARSAAYAAPIVYATAKTLAFDDLRSRLAGSATHDLARHAAALSGATIDSAGPRQRGLCMALLDEADSILLDEADVPLVLSRSAPHAGRRAFLWQALALARQLDEGAHFLRHEADRRCELTPAGEQHAAELARPLGGPWARARYRREALLVALSGLHLQRRNEHYLVRDGRIDLLDEVTGRVAEGRVWSRGLHTVVALKEGLNPGHDTETLARTTFQRFFQRYWRLAGTSGTLWEARHELQQALGASVLRVPLRQPGQRRREPACVFPDREALFAAAVLRTVELRTLGRPVLIGTDSVDDSFALSAALQAAGVDHAVLNALQDAAEAAVVAQAGQAGRVTVATRMAGRGTDIELDDAARAAGGLHVLNCQHNPSRRLDRQLAGRAARQGDPGSEQTWWTARNSWCPPGPLPNILAACNRRETGEGSAWVRPQWLLRLLRQWPQGREERRRRALREALMQADLAWERRLAFAGPSR